MSKNSNGFKIADDGTRKRKLNIPVLVGVISGFIAACVCVGFCIKFISTGQIGISGDAKANNVNTKGQNNGYDDLKAIYEDAGLELSKEDYQEIIKEGNGDNNGGSNNNTKKKLDKKNKDSIDKAKEDLMILNPDFNMKDLVNGVIESTTRYNKYIEYYGGLYEEGDKLFNSEEYASLRELNGGIVKYMVDGTSFTPEWPDISCDQYASIYKYSMFHDYYFTINGREKSLYPSMFKNYFKLGHPKFTKKDNVTGVLVTILDEDNSILYDEYRCFIRLTFICKNKTYVADMVEFAVDKNGKSEYEYRLVELKRK